MLFTRALPPLWVVTEGMCDGKSTGEGTWVHTAASSSGFPGSAGGKEPTQCRRRETWVQSLEEGVATHSNILAWTVTWTEEPGRLKSIRFQRVKHDRGDLAHTSPSETQAEYYSLGCCEDLVRPYVAGVQEVISSWGLFSFPSLSSGHAHCLAGLQGSPLDAPSFPSCQALLWFPLLHKVGFPSHRMSAPCESAAGMEDAFSYLASVWWAPALLGYGLLSLAGSAVACALGHCPKSLCSPAAPGM